MRRGEGGAGEAVPRMLLLLIATVALRACRIGADRAEGRSVLTRRAAVLLAAVALFTGPLAAVTWLEVRAGGPFDAALASTGSIAEPTAATIQARIEVQGAYGGSIHAQYTSVDQVRQLIKSGKISFAVVPADDVVTANNPRVQAVKQLCTKYNGTSPSYSNYLIYDCFSAASVSASTF